MRKLRPTPYTHTHTPVLKRWTQTPVSSMCWRPPENPGKSTEIRPHWGSNRGPPPPEERALLRRCRPTGRRPVRKISLKSRSNTWNHLVKFMLTPPVSDRLLQGSWEGNLPPSLHLDYLLLFARWSLHEILSLARFLCKACSWGTPHKVLVRVIVAHATITDVLLIVQSIPCH